MSKEELLKHIYANKETRTDGAYFSGELSKFSDREWMHQSLHKLSWNYPSNDLSDHN